MIEKADKTATENVAVNFSDKSVAVVADDNGRDGHVIKSILQGLQYEVVYGYKGAEEAVKMMESGIANIFFVNLENEGMDGLEAAALARKQPNGHAIPIFLSCVKLTSAHIKSVQNLNISSVIIKPIVPQTFTQHIQNACSKQMQTLRAERKAEESKILDSSNDSDYHQMESVYKQTLKKLSRIKASYPWSSGIFMEMSKLLARLGSMAKAIAMLKRASDLAPKDPKPYYLISHIYSDNKENDKAIEYAKKSLSMKKTMAAYAWLGELELAAGNLNGAIKHLSYVLASGESDKKATNVEKKRLAEQLNLRGKAYSQKGEQEDNKNMMENAVNDFKKSAEVSPSLIASSYNLMLTYHKMGESEKALSVLNRIKTLEPKDIDGWLQLSDAYYSSKDTAKVKFAIRKAFDLAKTLDDCKSVAEAYTRYGILDKAEELLVRLLTTHPEDTDILNDLGIIYRRKGMLEKAAEVYGKAVKLDDGDAALYFNYGRTLLDSGNLEEATKMFNKSKEIDPSLDVPEKFMEDIL